MMDIREQLLEEHSKENTMLIVAYVGQDPKRFEALLACFFADEYRITQRAAWAVSHCFDNAPAIFEPYIGQIIQNLVKENLHVAVKRNSIRILQFIKIPEDQEAMLFDICVRYLLDPQETIAVKVFSMQVAFNLCLKHQDLKGELIPLIEDNLAQSDKAGIHSRGKKLLKKLYEL